MRCTATRWSSGDQPVGFRWILGAALWLSTLPATAINVAWETVLPGGTGDPNAIIEVGTALPDGGISAIGRFSDDYALEPRDGLLILRLAANGGHLWSARIDLEAYSHYDSFKYQLESDAEGNVLVLARGALPGVEPSGWIAAKFDGTTGGRHWLRTVPLTQQETELNGRAAVDQSGNLILVSTLQAGVSHARWRIRKLAANDGAVEWDVQWPADAGSDYDRVTHVTTLPGGDVVAGGSITMPSGLEQRFVTARFAGEDGSLVWQVGEPGSEHASAVKVDAEGRIATMMSATLTLHDADGVELWRADLPGWEVAAGGPFLAFAANGDVMAAGMALGSETRIVRMMASDGSFLFDTQLPAIDGLSFGSLLDFDVGPNDQILVHNRYRSTDEFDPRLVAVARSATGGDGQPSWMVSVDLPVSDTPRFGGLAVADDGDVFMYTPARSVTGANDFRIDKIAIQDGGVLWTRGEISDQMSNTVSCGAFSREPRFSAVTETGDTVVAGCSLIDAGTQHMLVTRFDSNGNTLWSVPVAGDSSQILNPAGVKVDADGDVHVVFFHGGYESTAQLSSIYLSRSNGQTLRRELHSVEAVRGEIGHEIDDFGTRFLSWLEPYDDVSEVVVAAHDFVGDTPLWQLRIPPTGVHSQSMRLFGLDSAGNPILGGIRMPQDLNVASPLLQLRSKADGELIWEDFDDAAQGAVQALAFDSNGSILVGRGVPFGAGFSFSKHDPNGAVLWRSADLSPLGSTGASLRSLIVCGDLGDVCFAGRSNVADWRPLRGMSMVGRVGGVDGQLLWMDHNTTIPEQGSYEAISLVVATAGVIRAASFDWRYETGLQSMIVDYEPLTGSRLAVHPMESARDLRLHGLDDGTFRLVDDAFLLEGRRIRVRSLNDFEAIFADGFELLVE